MTIATDERVILGPVMLVPHEAGYAVFPRCLLLVTGGPEAGSIHWPVEVMLVRCLVLIMLVGVLLNLGSAGIGDSWYWVTSIKC